MKVLYQQDQPRPTKSPYSSSSPTSSGTSSSLPFASSTNSIFKPLMSLSPIACSSSASSFPPLPSPVFIAERGSIKSNAGRKKKKRNRKSRPKDINGLKIEFV